MRKGRRKLRRENIRRENTFIITLLIFIIMVLSGHLFIHNFSNSIKYTTINELKNPAITGMTSAKYSKIQKSSVSEEPLQAMDNVVNIALFGVDRRDSEIGNTDTMMIVSLDRNNKKLKLTSLMRDMYVNIPGKWGDRINAAYAYGGPSLAVDTINKNFDMDIKHYVIIDFKGLQRLINKLGGIDITIQEGEVDHLNDCLVTLNETDSDEPEPDIIQAGMQHLKGKQTVAYMRIRHYGNADYERTDRQRRVLDRLFEKIKKSGIAELPELVSTFFPYVETNMSKTDILRFGTAAFSFNGDIEQYRLPVDGLFSDEYIRDMAVLALDLEANTEKLHKFIYENNSNTNITP